MDERILEKLYETFQLSTRQGQGGMTFKYVPNEDVINRMNKVFGGDWSTKVNFRDTVDDQVILEVEVSVLDPGTQITHSHTGFGSQQIMRYNSGPNQGKIIDIGNAYKGALAKAIVNACTRWGVGLFKESNPMADSTPVEMPAVPMAPSAAPTAAPMVPETPTVAVSPIVVEPPTTVGPETPVVPPPPVAPAAPTPPAPEAPPTVETTTNFPPPMTPEQPVSASVNLQQEETPAMPKVPPPTMEAPPAVAPKTATPELPMTSNDTGLGEIKISDVQKVALNGLLTMNNAEYQPLAEEAFAANSINKAVPAREDLSYEEAVVVIKYGNEKYRKNR
jgi:hypothetical protein